MQLRSWQECGRHINPRHRGYPAYIFPGPGGTRTAGHYRTGRHFHANANKDTTATALVMLFRTATPSAGACAGFLLLCASFHISSTCFPTTTVILLLTKCQKRAGDPFAFRKWARQARVLLSFSIHSASASTTSSTATTILASFGFQGDGIARSAGSTYE